MINTQSQSKTEILAQFLGTIIEIDINDKECTVELIDLINESNPIECAEISFDNFPQNQLHLVSINNTFMWIIGNRTDKCGQIRRFSDIELKKDNDQQYWDPYLLALAKETGKKLYAKAQKNDRFSKKAEDK